MRALAGAVDIPKTPPTQRPRYFGEWASDDWLIFRGWFPTLLHCRHAQEDCRGNTTSDRTEGRQRRCICGTNSRWARDKRWLDEEAPSSWSSPRGPVNPEYSMRRSSCQYGREMAGPSAPDHQATSDADMTVRGRMTCKDILQLLRLSPAPYAWNSSVIMGSLSRTASRSSLEVVISGARYAKTRSGRMYVKSGFRSMQARGIPDGGGATLTCSCAAGFCQPLGEVSVTQDHPSRCLAGHLAAITASDSSNPFLVQALNSKSPSTGAARRSCRSSMASPAGTM